MKDLRFALYGTGFWSRFQLAAWRELEGATCVALYNRTLRKAQALAAEFGIPADKCYDDPARLLDENAVDFIDIITDVDTHARFAGLAAERGLDAITQKPMAPDLDTARTMIARAEAAGTKLYVHENFRWQTALRALKEVVDSGAIGSPWRAHVTFNSAFPVFQNQPFLAELDRFILTDVGTHILDVIRFLFGEARTIYAQNHQVNKGIKGEDATSFMLRMVNEMTVNGEISYASRLEYENFPETVVRIEGEEASIVLDRQFWLRLTTRDGTRSWQAPPPRYPWADPAYDCVHAAIVPCNENLLAGLNGTGVAETTATDNLKTLELVYAAYDSAEAGRVVAV